MTGKRITPTFADWYPDPDTGGTRYWDGSRWTGDTRPPRRPFAAAAHNRDEARFALLMGGLIAVGIVAAVFSDDPDEKLHAAALLIVPFVVAATVAVALYFFRGQGPTTRAVESRLAKEDEAAKKRRRAANFAGLAAMFGSRAIRRPQPRRCSRRRSDRGDLGPRDCRVRCRTCRVCCTHGRSPTRSMRVHGTSSSAPMVSMSRSRSSRDSPNCTGRAYSAMSSSRRPRPESWEQLDS